MTKQENNEELSVEELKQKWEKNIYSLLYHGHSEEQEQRYKNKIEEQRQFMLDKEYFTKEELDEIYSKTEDGVRRRERRDAFWES